MDFANRGNRPSQAPQTSGQQEQPTQSFQPVNSEKKGKKKVGFAKIISGVLLLGTTFLVLAVIFGLVFGKDNIKKESALIQADKYQAVFLDSQDGQVYFGKLAIYNNDLYELTDIYYVRVETPVQPEGQEAANTQQNISLAKLGNELHGPQDAMFVARDKVLYWENLKDDGQVVKAITDYKANGSQPTNQNTNNNTNTNNTSNQNNDNTSGTEETTNP